MENHVKKVNIVFKSELELKTKVFNLNLPCYWCYFFEKSLMLKKKNHLIFSFENHSNLVLSF